MQKFIIIIAILVSGLVLMSSCENNEEPKQEMTTHHESAAETSESKYINTGKELAIATKTSLGEKLAAAIDNSGFAGAIEFCNIAAIPLTDSMSKTTNSTIRRVSDKPRNPANQAKESELFYMNMFTEAQLEGKTLKPFLFEQNEKMVGYYPIVTNQMCLNCHGSNTDITAETLAKINSLYPKDMATGYKVNELRGLFVVEMEK